MHRFAIGLDDLADVVNDVKDIISKTPTAFPIQGILLRFSDSTDIYMSTAYGKRVVHFEYYEWKRKNVYRDPTSSLAGYQTILQTLVKPYHAIISFSTKLMRKIYFRPESITHEAIGENRGWSIMTANFLT